MLTIADPVALALAGDTRLRALPPGCDPARLFAVRLRDGDDFVLVPFWSGVAREIPDWCCPPRGASAIVLDTGGWAAPMEDDGRSPPGPVAIPRAPHPPHDAHPRRGSDVSVLRYEDAEEPLVLEGRSASCTNC